MAGGKGGLVRLQDFLLSASFNLRRVLEEKGACRQQLLGYVDTTNMRLHDEGRTLAYSLSLSPSCD